MWPVLVEQEVQWRDIDAAGHVNNAAYFQFMEAARVKAFRDVFGWRDPAEIEVIVAHAEADFERQVRMGDMLTTKVEPGEIGDSSFAFEYEIRDPTADERVATGRTVQVMFDFGEQTSRPIPDEIRKLLEG